MAKLLNDKCNFVIPLENQIGEEFKVFIPFIPKSNVDSIAEVLGELFNKLQKGLNVDVFIEDNQLIINDIIEKLCKNEDENKSVKLNNLINSFVERSLLTAEVMFPDGSFVSYPSITKDNTQWDGSCLNTLRGFLLFTQALWRYTQVKTKTTFLGPFIVYQSLSEWRSSFKKSCQEQKDLDTKKQKKTIHIKL
ncbi:TPA: hypothetical protein R1765_001956 [Campylobacter coli]|nr:hypothetical protein [Campylobacter coli]